MVIKYGHYCPEWDYMWIDETYPEIACCICWGWKDLEFKNIQNKWRETETDKDINNLLVKDEIDIFGDDIE